MFKIVSKTESSPVKENVMRILAVIIALLCSGLIIKLMGYSPFEVYSQIIDGSIGKTARFQRTIGKAIPLLVLSLGTAIAFKMKFWNIGAEGQSYNFV